MVVISLFFIRKNEWSEKSGTYQFGITVTCKFFEMKTKFFNTMTYQITHNETSIKATEHRANLSVMIWMWIFSEKTEKMEFIIQRFFFMIKRIITLLYIQSLLSCVFKFSTSRISSHYVAEYSSYSIKCSPEVQTDKKWNGSEGKMKN